MKQQEVNIILLNGIHYKGSLATPFQPKEKEVKLMGPLDQPQKFSLNEISCIQILGKPRHISPSHDDIQEQVETITGEKFHIRILGNKKYSEGFYGFPLSESASYRKIFFTFHGIRQSELNKPVGKILASQGAVHKYVLDSALEEQKGQKSQPLGKIIAKQNHIDQKKIEDTLKMAMRARLIPDNARTGDILIAAGLVTEKQVHEALSSQSHEHKMKIGDLLIRKDLISEEQLLIALATKFHLKYIDLDKVEPEEEALRALSRKVVSELSVMPIEIKDRHLVVATSKPTDPVIGDNLRFHTNKKIELVATTSEKIERAIEKYYLSREDSVEELLGEMSLESIEVEEEETEFQYGETDSKIIQLVNNILIDGYQKRASDVHFEPGLERNPLRVRYRVDGECYIAHQIPVAYRSAVIARLKILSKLDIAERRKPQSGKIMLRFENKKVEYRIETIPTIGGNEDAVLRILSDAKPLPLEEMDFAPRALKNFRVMLNKPYGLILCVGPTGSGKTTTLHSALSYLNKPDRKIWTAEDPVEITQSGLRQVQVNHKIGFTFEAALRSFLRSDPDIIMIGEMRDPETAEIAVASSLTGHLVFSTLHTNSAPETAVRLIEMGLDPFNFADALLGIIAQRLARRLCLHCRTAYPVTKEEYDGLVHAYHPAFFKKHKLPEFSPDLHLTQTRGCEQCSGIGYRGRLAVYELMIATARIKQAIKKGAIVEHLRQLAVQEGMYTLKMDGIRKVFQGLTDFMQITKVCV